MQITFNKFTALGILRAYRASTQRLRSRVRRSGLLAPDAAPKRRWTASALREAAGDMAFLLDENTVGIAVPDGRARVRGANVASTVYREGALPPGSFMNLGNGLAISGPELLFVELASAMNPVEHLMLGHELCGTFGRDAADPYGGDITYGLEPLTTVDKIGRFIGGLKHVRGVDAARQSLEFLNENAWSPTESLIAALLRLPADNLGYDLGELVLNPRVPGEQVLPGSKGSRVPDIVIAGTKAGINYDGLVHLDLDSVVSAAVEVGMHPETPQAQRELDNAARNLRAKAVDDIRRNRELAVNGLLVLPVLKEDLYAPGGLDAVVLQLIKAAEATGKPDLSRQRRLLKSTSLCKERHRLMLSFLPGRHERNIQVARFIEGHPVVEGQREVHEFWIEL